MSADISLAANTEDHAQKTEGRDRGHTGDIFSIEGVKISLRLFSILLILNASSATISEPMI
jgi:hypothetical protein